MQRILTLTVIFAATTAHANPEHYGKYLCIPEAVAFVSASSGKAEGYGSASNDKIIVNIGESSTWEYFGINLKSSLYPTSLNTYEGTGSVDRFMFSPIYKNFTKTSAGSFVFSGTLAAEPHVIVGACSKI